MATIKTSYKTIWVLIVFTAILLAWDIYAFNVAPADGTISKVMMNAAREHPIVPFVIGVIMGHLFWGQKIKSETKEDKT